MRSLLGLLSLFIWVASAISIGAPPDFGSTDPVTGQADPTGFTDPQDMSELALVRRIKGFEKMLDGPKPGSRQDGLRIILWEETIKHVDALLARFSHSAFTDQATTTKLKALAELARSDKARLGQLLELTGKIAGGNPGRQLSAENAYYAIQGFVLGARLESMPAPQRLLGTAERYEAFLVEHSTSEHVPVIRASLVRNLIALDQLARARRELTLLLRDHPGHRATNRARGEMYRVDAIGKPFVFDRTTSDGKTIRSEDHLGKVLVVHFWATWSQASRNAIPKLIALHRKYQANGLQLIGVNLDKSRDQIGKALDTFKMFWPQCFDAKGLDNEAIVSMGVVSVPVYFVVDRQGILRHISGGDDLPQLIESLLAEPAKKG